LVGGAVKIAKGNGVAINTCAEDVELEPFTTGKTDGCGRIAIDTVIRTRESDGNEEDEDNVLHFYL
jgi:hypothetical protein